jgi:fumarate reductase subunit D
VSPQPPYELPNASFKTFILRSPELDPLKGWRKEGVGSLWTALWPTLLVIIGLLMFFVVSSGQNTVKTAAALLASVVAALPVLMSVFAFARNNSRG